MNATQWETLTDFTKWLGREGENRQGLRGSGADTEARLGPCVKSWRRGQWDS